MKTSHKIAGRSRIKRLAQIGLGYKDWYSRAQREIRTVCSLENWSINRFVDVLAITSPRVSVRRNVRTTLNYLANDSLFANVMYGTRAALEFWNSENVIRGPKTEAFRRALLGDKSAVVLDVHMSYAFQVDQLNFGRKSTFRNCVRRIQNVANDLHLSPRDCQACVWVGAFRERLNAWPIYFPILAEYQLFLELGRTYPAGGSIDLHARNVRRARYDSRQQSLFA
jgi:hypothetical protein